MLDLSYQYNRHGDGDGEGRDAGDSGGADAAGAAVEAPALGLGLEEAGDDGGGGGEVGEVDDGGSNISSRLAPAPAPGIAAVRPARRSALHRSTHARSGEQASRDAVVVGLEEEGDRLG